MPPRIRTRATKAVKENIDTENKLKPVKNNTKASRKPLADKTNSASDDTSGELPKNVKKTPKSSKIVAKENIEDIKNGRPRRDRRLPGRFVKDVVLVNLVKSTDNISDSPKNTPSNNLKVTNTSVSKDKTKQPEASPFKTPSKVETSLVVNRPRRICRLPSRFDDHSISPHKYIPIQPANASTPIQLTKTKQVQSTTNKIGKESIQVNKEETAKPAKKATITAVVQKKTSNENSSPDSNNNAHARSTRSKKTLPVSKPVKTISPKINSITRYLNQITSPTKSPKKNCPKASKRIIDKSLSFKVLGGKKSQDKNKSNLDDIYEFTFDPQEDPQPQKKKKKRPPAKRPKVTKPKTVSTYKSTYDQNISKALSALKNAVAVPPSKTIKTRNLPQIQEISDQAIETITQNNVNNITNTVPITNNATMNDTDKTPAHECNYPSIRVEDIAADIEPSIDHCADLNYSPVNSPMPNNSPAAHSAIEPRQSLPKHVNDPLNLQTDLSFFDEVPVASSSMNMSAKHPLASPWRVEFGSLPIKWHSNTYVKPNMTPAVESSFICSEDTNKKKHVYTNMVPETNESLPEIVSNTSSLKQPSIISFIKEVAERQAKKKRGRSISPTKAMAVLANPDSGVNIASKDQVEKEQIADKDITPNSEVAEEISGSTNDASNDKENCVEKKRTRKRKNDENICEKPAKSPFKQKDKDCTYFGFDDSENHDQGNGLEVRGRSLRSKSRAVLQEINGPTRAIFPTAKDKVLTSTEAVNKVYAQLKSAADAPVFADKNVEQDVTNTEEASDDDGQSVHLFEDIALIHHLKPTRKSYGKAKKVTFRQRSTSSSDSEVVPGQINESSFDDDLGDLTFDVPYVQEKKKTKKKPKKLMSKKEEKEAEQWAAGFNSMCEEIEEFPLVVE